MARTPLAQRPVLENDFGKRQPQRGLASAMVRTRSASSEPTGGRPVRPRRDFQVQKARKPSRCQRITVSGRTTCNASRHRTHRCESHTQKTRARGLNRGRFERRRSRASCCRSARFSSARSAWVLSAARAAPNRASTRDIASRLASVPTPVQRHDRVLANDRASQCEPRLLDAHDAAGSGPPSPGRRLSGQRGQSFSSADVDFGPLSCLAVGRPSAPIAIGGVNAP